MGVAEGGYYHKLYDMYVEWLSVASSNVQCIMAGPLICSNVHKRTKLVKEGG